MHHLLYLNVVVVLAISLLLFTSLAIASGIGGSETQGISFTSTGRVIAREIAGAD